MVQPVVEQMETKPIVATGKFQLGPLAAAMSRCNLLITNDSGPMHVGISQGVPIVALLWTIKSILLWTLSSSCYRFRNDGLL